MCAVSGRETTAITVHDCRDRRVWNRIVPWVWTILLYFRPIKYNYRGISSSILSFDEIFFPLYPFLGSSPILIAFVRMFRETNKTERVYIIIVFIRVYSNTIRYIYNKVTESIGDSYNVSLCHPYYYYCCCMYVHGKIY